MMLKNIILGTAQFGMDYGITNSKGILKEKDCINILEEAKRLGINILDTAEPAVKKAKPKRTLIVLMSFFGGLLFAVPFAIYFDRKKI